MTEQDDIDLEKPGARFAKRVADQRRKRRERPESQPPQARPKTYPEKASET